MWITPELSVVNNLLSVEFCNPTNLTGSVDADTCNLFVGDKILPIPTLVPLTTKVLPLGVPPTIELLLFTVKMEPL